MTTLHAVGNWLYWFLGNKGSGSQYGFWSGAGSDIGEITLIGLVIGAVKQRNCHSHGCWHLGAHVVTTAEGTWKVCRRCFKTVHDLDRHPTVEELAAKVKGAVAEVSHLGSLAEQAAERELNAVAKAKVRAVSAPPAEKWLADALAEAEKLVAARTDVIPAQARAELAAELLKL